jgi:glycosyltransferase involved in cell wall biosynthesis
MRIAIVNHYSGSSLLGMGYRHFYMAKELQALGHDVFIVASRYSHLRIVQPEQTRSSWSDHCGIPHLWLAGCSYPGNGIKRLLNMFGFAGDLWRSAPAIARERRPDMVLASSPHPLSVYGAARLADVAGARFVFEIRDLWPLSLVELGSLTFRNPVIRVLDHAEAYGCRRADKVVSLLPCVHDYMTQRGVHQSRWVHIPNGVLPSEWERPWPAIPKAMSASLSDLRGKGFHIVGYAGAHGVPNELDTLLDAAALLRNEKIAIALVGSGSEKLRLQRRAMDERLDNVHFFEPVRKKQIPALLQWFDVAYIGWHRQPLYRFGIAPNKLMDYMMAGRPVLHAVDAGNDSVRDANCGITVPPKDPHAVASGLRRLMGLSEEERTGLGNRGRDFVVKNHSYPLLAQRLLSACG